MHKVGFDEAMDVAYYDIQPDPNGKYGHDLLGCHVKMCTLEEAFNRKIQLVKQYMDNDFSNEADGSLDKPYMVVSDESYLAINNPSCDKKIKEAVLNK